MTSPEIIQYLPGRLHNFSALKSTNYYTTSNTGFKVFLSKKKLTCLSYVYNSKFYWPLSDIQVCILAIINRVQRVVCIFSEVIYRYFSTYIWSWWGMFCYMLQSLNNMTDVLLLCGLQLLIYLITPCRNPWHAKFISWNKKKHISIYYNFSSIQWRNRWGLGIDNLFHPILYRECDYSSELGLLKLILDSKMDRWQLSYCFQIGIDLKNSLEGW